MPMLAASCWNSVSVIVHADICMYVLLWTTSTLRGILVNLGCVVKYN